MCEEEGSSRASSLKILLVVTEEREQGEGREIDRVDSLNKSPFLQWFSLLNIWYGFVLKRTLAKFKALKKKTTWQLNQRMDVLSFNEQIVLQLRISNLQQV